MILTFHPSPDGHSSMLLSGALSEGLYVKMLSFLTLRSKLFYQRAALTMFMVVKYYFDLTFDEYLTRWKCMSKCTSRSVKRIIVTMACNRKL